MLNLSEKFSVLTVFFVIIGCQASQSENHKITFDQLLQKVVALESCTNRYAVLYDEVAADAKKTVEEVVALQQRYASLSEILQYEKLTDLVKEAWVLAQEEEARELPETPKRKRSSSFLKRGLQS